MVKVTDYRLIENLLPEIREHIENNYPDANLRLEKIRLGPGTGFPVETRFSGPDPSVLRGLSEQVKSIYRKDPLAGTIRDDWRDRVKVVRPQFSEAQARRVGISRAELAEAMETGFSGTKVGIYREGDELLPINVTLTRKGTGKCR